MTGTEDFFGQFIDDYFAECDEHLATARRVLLALEDGASSGAPDPALMRELHRSLHTLKGLAGMVGDASAESVAHAIEDALRTADRSARPLVGDAIDAIFVGVDALERCIAARRAGTPAPDVASVLTGLARALPFQVGVGQLYEGQATLVEVVGARPNQAARAEVVNGLITRFAVAATEFQLAQHRLVFEEWLFHYPPARRNGREITHLVVGTENRALVPTHGSPYQIASFE